jgi:hypothetical protein
MDTYEDRVLSILYVANKSSQAPIFYGSGGLQK